MRIAAARHILVTTKEQAEKIKKQIEDGADFAELARKNSMCPSGKNGGDLGKFVQGEMVKEFDEVVFNEELNKVHGPVETQFGFHLIEIISRT